jgi:glutathione S-transferase
MIRTASAPCRSVLMVAAALKLKLSLKSIDLMQAEHLKPEFLRINPHHTIPTLVDNEFSMNESRAICIYLVEKYGKNDSLYPKNAKTRATINQLIYFDMDTLFKRFYEYFITPWISGAERDEKKHESLIEALNFLEHFLKDKKFLVAYKFTIADLIIFSSVSTIEAFGEDLSQFVNISTWLANMKENAPGREENTQGLEMLKAFMQK